MDTKKTPNPVFELHAINLLLATPSTLGRAFSAGDDQKIKEALAALPLTTVGRVAALTRIMALQKARGAAKLFADEMKENAYAGSEPHPEPLQAVAIVEAMKALDAAMAAEEIRSAIITKVTGGGDK